MIDGDWDASEDEAEPVSKPQPKPVVKKPIKVVKEVVVPAYVEPTPEQIAAEIKASRLAEAEDLFGLNEQEKPHSNGHKLDENLDEMSLASSDDYRSFATNIAGRIAVETRGNHKRMTFLRELLKAASGPLSAEEINELKSSLNVLFNEKKKAMTTKKKPKKVGKNIKVSGGLDGDFDDGPTFEDDY